MDELQPREFEMTVFTEISKSPELYEPLSVRIDKAYLSMQRQLDAEVEVSWQDRRLKFDAEIVSRTSPQMLGAKAFQLIRKKNFNPLMLIVPYLSESVVGILRENEMSGLDLNGNYYIITPDLLAVRLDQKNEYRESATIRKIYSGNSSIVCRYILTSKALDKGVGSITEDIRKQGGDITLSTVSKVLKRLEEELVIGRSSEQIKVLQKEKLLDNLRNDYVEPKILDEWRIQVPTGPLEFLKRLRGSSMKWTLSGASSAGKYTVATFPQALEVYCEDIDRSWFEREGAREENRFFNLVLKKTKSDFVYFDRLPESAIFFSSKVQTYIELSRGGKREKETVESLREELLK